MKNRTRKFLISGVIIIISIGLIACNNRSGKNENTISEQSVQTDVDKIESISDIPNIEDKTESEEAESEVTDKAEETPIDPERAYASYLEYLEENEESLNIKDVGNNWNSRKSILFYDLDTDGVEEMFYFQYVTNREEMYSDIGLRVMGFSNDNSSIFYSANGFVGPGRGAPAMAGVCYLCKGLDGQLYTISLLEYEDKYELLTKKDGKFSHEVLFLVSGDDFTEFGGIDSRTFKNVNNETVTVKEFEDWKESHLPEDLESESLLTSRGHEESAMTYEEAVIYLRELIPD